MFLDNYYAPPKIIGAGDVNLLEKHVFRKFFRFGPATFFWPNNINIIRNKVQTVETLHQPGVATYGTILGESSMFVFFVILTHVIIKFIIRKCRSQARI